MPTGIVFITIDNVYMQPTIVIAVNKLGINNVKPFAPLANQLAAVPKITAIIRITFERFTTTKQIARLLEGKIHIKES